jgi:putative ABC transport system permease protein
LQQRIVWPEKKRTIILAGTRGEIPNLSTEPKKPLVQPVPVGSIVLGYELAGSLGYSPGDKVTLMGREFIVHQVHEERGNQDDITAWIHLKEAQEILNKEGRINAILALGCMCAGPERLHRIRADIAQYLPDTQVIEMGAGALARFEARSNSAKRSEAAIEQVKQERQEIRKERANLAAVLVPLISGASALCVGLLGFTNVSDRWAEIGILRAIGFRSRQIMILFLSKSLIIGFVGGVLGICAGVPSGSRLGYSPEETLAGSFRAAHPFDPAFLLVAFLVASLLTIIGGWIPATLAANRDPASVLRDE